MSPAGSGDGLGGSEDTVAVRQVRRTGESVMFFAFASPPFPAGHPGLPKVLPGSDVAPPHAESPAGMLN
ncbi:hypothetical protein FRC06_004488 [Ceratobasidium sp. 370]|nr:hypothetical protein FRC06_004488 [Ceratobasidium sp. 370]